MKPVIDDHSPAGEIQIPRHHHTAICRGAHSQARGGGDIDPVMRLARLTVQDLVASRKYR